jgi:hypothetical protein
MTPHPNVSSQVLVLGTDKDIGLYPQSTKLILTEDLTISVYPKICKDVGSELELLDCKISTLTNSLEEQFSMKNYDVIVRQGLKGLMLIYKMYQTKLNPKTQLSPLLLQAPFTKPTQKLGCLS